MKLKGKIFFGFLILALMLFIAGAWSVYQLNILRSSVSEVIAQNNKNIKHAREMIEAVEREDSGILLLHTGHWKHGREIIRIGDSLFVSNLNSLVYSSNESKTDNLINEIEEEYKAYKNLWEQPIVGTRKQGDLDWYFREVHTKFQDVKDKISQFLMVNEEIIYSRAIEMSEFSNSAIIPGIIASVSALGFVFIFTYLANYFIITPIISLSKRIKLFIDQGVPIGYEIETKDELYDLEDSIRMLSSIIESNRKNLK